MIKQEQLIGLCDEIAALVRLDLPLEEALRTRSRDLPKHLGDRVGKLAERLDSGETLSNALENDKEFPPVYAAVVRAGLESGNLSGTLEQLAKSLQILRNSKDFLLGATLYPMFVFSVLWILLSWVLVGLGPVYADFFEDFSFTLPLIEHLRFCREHTAEFLGGMATVLLLLWTSYGIWCYRSSRSTLLTFQPPRWFFWLRSANRDLACASFARIMILLLRSGLPLPKALDLAFHAVGDRLWTAENEKSLELLLTNEDNDMFKRYAKSPITPLVRWMFGVSDQNLLISGLEQYADMGAYRAKSHLERLELWLPVLLMFLLGGAVFLAYFLTIIFPYGYLLYHLSNMWP